MRPAALRSIRWFRIRRQTIMHGLADTTADVLDAMHNATRWVVADSSISTDNGNACRCRDELPAYRNPEYG